MGVNAEVGVEADINAEVDENVHRSRNVECIRDARATARKTTGNRKAKAEGGEPLCFLNPICQNRESFSGILAESREPAHYLTGSRRRNSPRR